MNDPSCRGFPGPRGPDIIFPDCCDSAACELNLNLATIAFLQSQQSLDTVAPCDAPQQATHLQKHSAYNRLIITHRSLDKEILIMLD